MNWNIIKQLFVAGSGVSSMRWVFVWTYLFSIVVPLTAWAIVYIRTSIVGMDTVDLPSGVVTLIIAVIATVTGGKVAQGFGEGSVEKLKIEKNGGSNVDVPPKS